MAFLILVNLIGTPVQVQPVFAAGTNCVTSSSPSGTYTVTPCITAPADGGTVTGAQTISATYSTTGANPGVAKLIFYLGGNYLITDYQTPYSFTLPSTKFMDGTYLLEVEALMKDGFTSQRSSITITLNNGITTPPKNTNTFTPATGTTPPAGQPFVLVAAGDGADGATNANNVSNMIASWNPNLFLYVGDVYEKGSITEFYNWYGQGSTFYGRFRPLTDPVVGNHEYENGSAPGYFDYWDNVPNYYSFDANGWHFIALNSNCGLLQNCAAGQAQYNWLLNDLSTHPNQCTIAYFHHPVYNVGPEGYTTTMNPMWALMAQHGVDIVLTGHDHDYQRWVPLDANGVPSPTGITQFITGTGGHGIQQFIVTDSRMAVGYDTSPFAFGALRLQLNHDGAGFQFINSQGLTLDSGAIPCSGAPADTTAPSVPANLTAAASSSHQIDLSWGSSTDNVGIAGYDIYRDGSLLTSVGYVTTYSDTNLTLGSSHSYQIKARDAAGNRSAFSNSASVALPNLLFSEGFESGNLSAWTSVTNLATTTQEHYSGSYGARATGTGTTASFALKTLSATQTDLYYTAAFKVLSLGSTSAYLQRVRTAANGALMGIFINGATGKLGYRNDIAAASTTNGPVVSLNVWHQLQTHVKINDTSSLVEVWLDGVPVPALTKTDSLGTSPIGRIQLGDSSTTDVYDIAFDEVGVNTSFIDTSDAQAPNTPTGLSANAAAPNAVNLTWNAATDNVGVTGYDIYRNGSLATTLGAVTSYADTPVSPAFTYQYQILARDGAGNVSALSAPISVTTPADTTAPTVALTSPANGLTVNGKILISADASDNVGVEDVDLLINNIVVATIGEGGPYNFLWDTTTVPDGTTATIVARATDTSANVTNSASRMVTVNNAAGDTLPPSLPGNFAALAAGATRVDLSWNASTDNIGIAAYDVYRDSVLLTSADGATTTYSDSNVTQGATYQYQVQARDAANNVSGLTSALPVTVPAPLFKDGFESGDLSQWVNSGLSVQQQSVLEGAYAARGTSNGTVPAYAYKQLTAAQNDLYYAAWFRIASQGATSAYLQRLRTSANGAVLGVFVSSTGKLGYRNDVTATTTTSTTGVSPSAWHLLQTHVRVNGTSSQVEVWLDGVRIPALSKTESLGTNPIGRVQLGDSQSSDIYDIAFDEAAFDTSFLQTSGTLNTLIDSGPLGLVNTNSGSFSFSSTFAGATFECSLDAGAFNTCTSPVAFSGLTDGAHTFAVRALDGLGGVDQTPASRLWTIDTALPTVTAAMPPNGATGLATNAAVSAAFSEPIDSTSISTSTFTLLAQGSTTPVVATVNYDVNSNTATLQPSAPLANSTLYTATLKSGGVKDLAGNTLAADVTWSFTTIPADTAAPTVSVTAPLDGATVAGMVTLFATASDDVAVDHVDFLVNGNVVGTAAAAPYTLDWNSTSLANSTATITAQAYDPSNNQGASAPVSVTIDNDVTAPSVPADLAANASSGTQVDLTWTASTDDFGVTGYDILRNGVPLTSVGAVINYSDLTVAPGTPYLYQIRARDAAGNVSALSTAVSVTTPDALFSDRFESGDLSRWSLVNGMTVQNQVVFAGQYSARATSSGAIVDAFDDLSTPQYELYYDIHFKLLSQDSSNSIYLMRLRKADTLSALGVFVSPTGKLGYRNDVAGIANTSTRSVSLNAWHELQVHIYIDSAGGAGLVETWLDGAAVQSQAEALGNAPITRIQLSDSTAGRTYDVVFDNVVAATYYVNPGDVSAPSTPGNLNASAPSATQVDLTWDASTDDFGVIGYDLYRDGTLLAELGPVAGYSDTSAAPLTSYQYQVRARDASENVSGLSNTASVTTPPDTTPPMVTLVVPINGEAFGGVKSLTATASDDVAVDHVDFLVNGVIVGSSASAPYSFDWDSTSIPDGPATITASAVDTSANAATSTVTVTIDNTPPDTTITSGPAAYANSTTAGFTFTTNDPTASLSCSLDGAVYNVCASPRSFTGLTNGTHTFSVRATDPAGNIDPTPASLTWAVDIVVPTVLSTAPANNATNVPPITNVVVTFSEDMNPATITTSTFSLKPSAAGSSPVAATVVYDPVTHKATLQPSATLSSQTSYTAALKGGSTGIRDLAGNALANKTWSFTTSILDTTPPVVTLTAPVNNAKVKGTLTLTATATDNVLVSSVSFLANGTVIGTDTTSPYSLTWNTTSIPDGSVTLAARAVDPSNNAATSANINVTVDNTPPDTAITSGPSGSVASTTAGFTFTATEAATFACKLDNGSYTTCTSPVTYTLLADGAHIFSVRATDAVGNVDATPASQSWTVISPPDTAITAGPAGTVTSTSASFSFTSTKSGSTFVCSLDGAAFSTCTSPQSYSNLAYGSHTFQVAAVAQGLTDPTPAGSTWIIAPNTTITAGPTGIVSATSATFSFTSSKNGSTFTCSLDGAAFTACTSPITYTGLSNASHTFQVAATYSGFTDPSPASRTWTVDALAPTGVAITSPSNGATVTGQVTIRASASDNVGVASISFYADGQLLSTDTSSPFSVTWNTNPVTKTTHTLYVRAADTAGNVTQSASITVTVK